MGRQRAGGPSGGAREFSPSGAAGRQFGLEPRHSRQGAANAAAIDGEKVVHGKCRMKSKRQQTGWMAEVCCLYFYYQACLKLSIGGNAQVGLE